MAAQGDATGSTELVTSGHSQRLIPDQPLDLDPNTSVPVTLSHTGSSSSFGAIESSRSNVLGSMSTVSVDKNSRPSAHDQNLGFSSSGSSYDYEVGDSSETTKGNQLEKPGESEGENLEEDTGGTQDTPGHQLGTVDEESQYIPGQTVSSTEVLAQTESPMDISDEEEGATAADTVAGNPDSGNLPSGEMSEEDILGSYFDSLFQPDSDDDLSVEQQVISWFDGRRRALHQVENQQESHFDRIALLFRSDRLEEHTALPQVDLELFKACYRGLDLDLTISLLDRGANVNARIDIPSPANYYMGQCSYRRGDTPLHTLMSDLDWNCDSQNILDHIRLLGERGAVPDVINVDGKTPIMLAVEKQSPRTVELLVGLSRNVDVRNHVEQTALHLCFHHFRQSDPSLLSQQNCIQIARALINAGAHMDVMDVAFQTPLILAIKNHFPKGALFLLRQNCDPNFPAGSMPGQTNPISDAMSPFAICLQVGDWRTLHFLLQAGCRYRILAWSELRDEAQECAPDLVYRCSSPRSLMVTCRMLILRALRGNGVVGDRLEEVMKGLPIPGNVREYLLLKDQCLSFCPVS